MNDSDNVTNMTPQMTTIIARTASMKPPMPVRPGRRPVLVLMTVRGKAAGKTIPATVSLIAQGTPFW
jgi:hypothetical protein